MSKATRSQRGCLALLLTLMAAGCSDSSTEPNRDAIAADAFAQAAAPGFNSFTFGPGGLPHEMACPAGGKRTTEGTTSMQATDTELTATWSIRARHIDCAIRLNQLTLVTSGSTTSTGRMRMRTPAGFGERPAILEFEGRDQGEMTTRNGSQSRTCRFDLTQRYDATRNELRLTGTSCGQSISIVRTQPW